MIVYEQSIRCFRAVPLTAAIEHSNTYETNQKQPEKEPCWRSFTSLAAYVFALDCGESSRCHGIGRIAVFAALQNVAPRPI